MIAIEITLLVGALLIVGFLVGISVERTRCSEHRRARERARRHHRYPAGVGR